MGMLVEDSYSVQGEAATKVDIRGPIVDLKIEA